MISIQDVGTQILSGTPKPFYVFVGEEYGIKERYIEILKDHYGDQLECPSVSDILSTMRTKHLIPLKPTLYVVRYDEEFITGLDANTAAHIESTNIIGTIVCIYEQPKHISKLSKHLPDFTVSIDTVSPQFVKKYLHADFPDLPDRFINIAVQYTDNYSQAKNMCRCMAAASTADLYSCNDTELSNLFGCNDLSTESQIKKGVAAKSFSYLISIIEKFPDAIDTILYAILSTMVELDKISDNSYVQSDLREYVELWTRPDIYHMFMNTYNEIHKLRSGSSYDSMNSLIYLISLLNFPNIPAPEVLK